MPRTLNQNSMHDPQVVRLHYSLQSSDSVSYTAPPTLSVEQPGFRVVLESGDLTVVMRQHHASERDARKVVEPFLRAWQIHDELVGTGAKLRFVFKSADVIDRSAKRAESVVLNVHSASHAHTADSVTLHVNYRHYPEPPLQFAVTPDVEAMWNRYQRYLSGQEPLPAMAYFCLTVLEAAAGNRAKTAARFGVDVQVLRKIGELSSSRGDSVSARKARAVGRSLTGAEKRWLEAALRQLIARVAECAGGKAVTNLGMSHLPAL